MTKEIKYVDRNWLICVGLKMVNFELDQQLIFIQQIQKNFHVFSAYGTVELRTNIMSEKTGP